MPESIRLKAPKDQSEQKVLGFKRDDNDPNLWTAFSDRKTMLEAPIEDVVLGNSTKCLSLLHDMYPPADPDLIRVEYYTGSWRNNKRLEHIRVYDDDDQCYRGDDQRVALRLAKRYGKISCRGVMPIDPSQMWPRVSKQEEAERKIDWAAEGCIVKTTSGHTDWGNIRHVEYNPKKRRSLEKAKATRKKRAPVGLSKLSRCFSIMRQAVRNHVGVRFDYYQSTRRGLAAFALDTVECFSLVFGKNAYRQHVAFREAKDLWKERADSTFKAFTPRKNQWGGDRIETFRNFMDAEIRIRDGEIKPDSHWKAPRKVFDKTPYTPKEYNKVLKEREAKAAKAAKAKQAKGKKGKKAATAKRARVAKAGQGNKRKNRVARKRAHANV